MKVNLIELLVIVVAILWTAGYFRKLYASSNQNLSNQNNNTNASPSEKPSRRSGNSGYGDDGEFVDYEEIK